MYSTLLLLQLLKHQATTTTSNKFVHNFESSIFFRLANDKKVPSAHDRARYRKVMKKAQDQIIHRGYDIG